MLGNLAWCGKMRTASLCVWILVFWNTVIVQWILCHFVVCS